MIGPAAGGAYDHIQESVSPIREQLRFFIRVRVAADFAGRIGVILGIVPCNGQDGGHAIAFSFEFRKCPPFNKHGLELDKVLFLFFGGLCPIASFRVCVKPPA